MAIVSAVYCCKYSESIFVIILDTLDRQVDNICFLPHLRIRNYKEMSLIKETNPN